MRLKNFTIALLMALTAAGAFAASATTHLNVSLTVLPNCQVGVTDLQFGTYDPLLANSDQPLDATADLTMLCTKEAQATIKLDYGRSPLGPNRSMMFGSERVSYGLFQDASRTKLWADGENTLHIIGNGGRTPQRYVVYGRVPAGQEVPPGAYSDVVMATVDF